VTDSNGGATPRQSLLHGYEKTNTLESDSILATNYKYMAYIIKTLRFNRCLVLALAIAEYKLFTIFLFVFRIFYLFSVFCFFKNLNNR
jgi:hypothetical protein